MKRTILYIAIIGTLSGCANMKAQWSISYQTDNLATDMAAAREETKQKPISYSIAR